MDKAYVDTVRLLLETAPHVFRGQRFALKGGTALNLFVRNMPRLSVDIDVVYADYKPGRVEAMEEIATQLNASKKELTGIGIDAELVSLNTGEEVKLLVQRAKNQVKVEVNFVFRGTLLPVEPRNLVHAARDLFTTELSLPVLAEPELYGSKMVAALDRQHPRDFFDIRGMYQSSGLTLATVECFVSYLAGHNRPVHEVLFSRNIDIALAFENEFQGMTLEPVSLEELLSARDRLRSDLSTSLTPNQRQFLLSLVGGEPAWELMICPHLREIPAIRWKLENLAKLKKGNRAKFQLQTDELQKRFEMG